MSIVEWNGDELIARLDIRSRDAVSEIADRTADFMRANHPWENYTGAEELSIFSDGPHEAGDTVWAQAGALMQPWGFRGSPQLRLPAMYLEFGTHKMDARPFIRPAAAAVFPEVFALLRDW